MDVLRHLPITETGNDFIVVKTGRYPNLTRAIPTSKTNATEGVHIFVEDWIVPYDIKDQLMTDNDPQLVGKLFDAVCAAMGTESLITTNFHLQTNGQFERYNKTILNRLFHYKSEHQKDRDTFVQPLAYAYNAQTHGTTKTSPFNLTMTREPPAASGLLRPFHFPSHAKQSMTSMELRSALSDHIWLMQTRDVATAF